MDMNWTPTPEILLKAPLTLIELLISSDHATEGRPELPSGSRHNATEWLRRVLTDFDALEAYNALLSQLYGEPFRTIRPGLPHEPPKFLPPAKPSTRFRHHEPLADDRTEAVAEQGLTALTDPEVAALLLNPYALLDLFHAIDLLSPEAWQEAWHISGGGRPWGEMATRRAATAASAALPNMGPIAMSTVAVAAAAGPVGAALGGIHAAGIKGERWAASTASFPDEEVPQSFGRTSRAVGWVGRLSALAASLLFGVLIGASAFREPGGGGGAGDWPIDASLSAAGTRGAAGIGRVEIRSRRDGYATIVGLTEGERPEVVPGVGGDLIPVKAGQPAETPLPEGAPAPKIVLVVVTETPAGEEVRRALRNRRFEPSEIEGLRSYLESTLKGLNYKALGFAVLTAGPDAGSR